MKKQLVKNPDRVREIIGWLSLADDDYISARVLIDNGLLTQGAILSVTAIEKYLKMIAKIHDLKLPMRGDPHNVADLYKIHKNNGATFNLNEDYLRLLVKVYKFRYPDKLEPNFSFALNQTKLMVALDESVSTLRGKIKRVDEKGKKQTNSRIQIMLNLNDPRLLRANHTFGKVKRRDLFIKPSIWHEVRFVDGKYWLEAHYTGKVEDSGIYNLSGLDQGENELQFKLKSSYNQDQGGG